MTVYGKTPPALVVDDKAGGVSSSAWPVGTGLGECVLQREDLQVNLQSVGDAERTGANDLAVLRVRLRAGEQEAMESARPQFGGDVRSGEVSRRTPHDDDIPKLQESGFDQLLPGTETASFVGYAFGSAFARRHHDVVQVEARSDQAIGVVGDVTPDAEYADLVRWG